MEVCIMAQSVVVKKEEKVNKIFSELGKGCSFEEFYNKFKEDYPDDWEKINKVWREHENRDKKEKDIRCQNLVSI